MRNLFGAVLRHTLLLFGLLACRGPSGPPEAELARNRQLVKLDEDWTRRGLLGDDARLEGMLAAATRYPGDPAITWRWARHEVYAGLASEDPSIARQHFARARDMSVQCVLDDPGFRAGQQGRSWSEGLELLSSAREDCALWAAFSWLRWVVAVGVTAAEVDLARITALVSHLEDKAQANEDMRTWTRGLHQVVVDSVNRQSSPSGRVLLTRVVEAKPDELPRAVDLFMVSGAPAAGSLSVLLDRVLSTDSARTEDQLARARLLEFLEGNAEL